MNHLKSPPMQSTFEQVRLSVFQIVLAAAVVVNLSLMIYQFGIEQMPLSTFEIALRIVLALLAVWAFVLLQKGSRAYLISQIVIIASVLLLFVTETAVETLAVGTFVLAVAAIFAHNTLLTFALVVYFAQLVVLSNRHDAGGQATVNDFEMVLLSLLMVMTVGLLRYFVTRVRGTIESATRSVQLLHATSVIGQVAAQMLDEKQLFKQSVELIRDQFGYDHVQVFLVDEDQVTARLIASTGSAGRELLRRGHHLAVGSQSVIGRVTQLGKPIVATESNSIHARNELLPNTRSELALPLADGDQIIGALDVQSTEVNAFSPDDVQALQVMANQLAIAVRNARLFQQQELNTRENERLLAEARAATQEIERLNRQLMGSAWQDYLKADASLAGITLDEEQEQLDAEWTPQMIAAREKKQAVIEADRVAIPIMLRGEVLGAVEVDTVAGVRRDDAVEVIETVVNRLAVSLENARLFQTAQDTTAQEQRINEIVGLFQSTNSVDDLLQVTLKELTETLGANAGMIRLTGRTNDTHGAASGNGSHLDGDRGA